jgi:hypothetical protein
MASRANTAKIARQLASVVIKLPMLGASNGDTLSTSMSVAKARAAFSAGM